MNDRHLQNNLQGVKVATVIGGRITTAIIDLVVGDGPGAAVVLLGGGVVMLSSCMLLD